ncbi:hypothetical protein ACWGKM_39005, partial [Streptomyces sp. NPDC054771]
MSRAGRSLLVLIVVAALTCQLALLLPGDPALVLLGQESTEAQREALRSALGLDQDFFTRFFDWSGGVLTGDWGTSLTSGRPVLTEILYRVPATAELVVLSQIVALAVSIPLALHSARRPGEAYDLTGSYRAAAELARCDHHTVARHVKMRAAGQLPDAPRHRDRSIDVFLPRIEELVVRSNGRIRADVVHKRITAMGFTGGERTT